MLNEVDILTKHLLNRPIGPIFSDCEEKTNIKVLQLLCIIDFHTGHRDLYSRIQNSSNPKLLSQLLRFRKIENFKCYDYQIHSRVAKQILQCKFCELIGPYKSVLAHMAITHDAHISTIDCAYCNRNTLKTHFSGNSLDKCYNNYLIKHSVQMDNNTIDIVNDFYRMLIEVCTNLGICRKRQNFLGHGRYKSVQQLGTKYGSDFPNECTVFQPSYLHNDNKIAQNSQLETEAKQILCILYGEDYPARILHPKTSKSPPEAEDVICLDSDDDDDDIGANQTPNRAEFRVQRCKPEYIEQKSINIKSEFMVNENSVGTAGTLIDINDQMVTRETATKRKLSDPSTTKAKFMKLTPTGQNDYNADRDSSTLSTANISTNSNDSEQFGRCVMNSTPILNNRNDGVRNNRNGDYVNQFTPPTGTPANLWQPFSEQPFSSQSSPNVVSSTTQMNAAGLAPKDIQTCNMSEHSANASPSVESAANSSTAGTDLFGSLVAQKLAQIQDRSKRAKTELAILATLVNAGTE